MDVDQEELIDGKIGRATTGDLTGCYIKVEAYSDSPESWVLYWRNPQQELGPVEALGSVAGDRIIPDRQDLADILDNELGVEWLDVEKSEDVRSRYFSFPEPPAGNSWMRRLGKGGRA